MSTFSWPGTGSGGGGGGVTSLNGLTGALNLIAGQSISITPLGTNITLAAVGGNLTDAGTDGIVITGGSGAVIGAGTSISQHVADTTHNGYLSSTDWNTFNNKQSTLTLGNLTDAGTDGITVTGGTGSVVGSGTSLSQHVADTTHNGYLSSTDWNTFSGKQAAGNYITALTSDVSAAGPGSVAATVNSVGGSSATNIHSAELAANAAASINTASTIVKRDGSGNFSAGTITASLSGNATNVTGTVLIANGGTGQVTKFAAFNALSPTTTTGDIIVYSSALFGNIRYPIGIDDAVLTADSGFGAGLAWRGVSSSGYYLTTNQIISGSGDFQLMGWTQNWDSDSSFASDQYTAPYFGYYTLSMQAQVAGGSNNVFGYQINAGSVQYFGTNSTLSRLNATITIQLNKLDILKLYISAAGAETVTGGSNSTYFTIVRA